MSISMSKTSGLTRLAQFFLCSKAMFLGFLFLLLNQGLYSKEWKCSCQELMRTFELKKRVQLLIYEKQLHPVFFVSASVNAAVY